MPDLTPITIAGGGLAGLSLGVALRRAGVPVELLEAGTYPRHRVCGEFINGVRDATLEALGVADLLAAGVALRHRSTRWFRRGREVYHAPLPRPAIGLSRHALDARLAARFAELGGTLREGARARRTPRAGLVWAAGRPIEKGAPWVGLKCHVESLPISGDLEMHLGSGGYVGLAPVGDGRVNLCGLFATQRLPAGLRRLELLLGAMRAHGLDALADKVAAARPDEASFCGAAGFAFGRPCGGPELCSLGDAAAIIPPFTGNGMSMAFESAEAALAPLVAYSRGRAAWPETCAAVAAALRKRFRRRLLWSRIAHPFLLRPAGQLALTAAGRTGILPFRLLHSLMS